MGLRLRIQVGFGVNVPAAGCRCLATWAFPRVPPQIAATCGCESHPERRGSRDEESVFRVKGIEYMV